MLFAAGFMLLLHTLVPHSHLGESSSSNQKRTFSEAKNILDYIQIMFLTDLGEGHMEHFENGDGLPVLNITLHNDSSFLAFISDHEFKEIIKIDYISNPDYPPKFIPSKAPLPVSFNLRGPPNFLS